MTKKSNFWSWDSLLLDKKVLVNNMSNQNMVPAVVSSLRILELLAKESFREATLTEISKELSINRSSCFRILRTLEAKEYVKYNERTKQYSLGSRLILLGDRAKEFIDYIEIARSMINELTSPDVTFVLVKRTRDNRLMYVAKQEPMLPVRLSISSDTFPIPFGSLGKCFYAFLSKEEQNSILHKTIVNGELPKYTEKSITSLEVFEAEIEEIQKEKMAESNEEFFTGLTTLACPIFYKNGEIILALGAYMFRNHNNITEIEELKETLKSTAEKITTAISQLHIEEWTNDIN